MKYFFLFFFMCSSVLAETNLSWCLEYMTTNAPNSFWSLQDDSNGQGVRIAVWNSTIPKPTLAQAYAVWVDAALWKSNKVNTAKADFESWDKSELKALVLVLIDEINILRAKHALPDRTPTQLKQAIKAKL